MCIASLCIHVRGLPGTPGPQAHSSLAAQALEPAHGVIVPKKNFGHTTAGDCTERERERERVGHVSQHKFKVR